MKTTYHIVEAIAWLESKAPYSTAEGDQRHGEIAALVRALENVRVAATYVSSIHKTALLAAKRCDCSVCESLAEVTRIENGEKP